MAIMNDKLIFRLFWGERRESASQCAQRVYKTFRKLTTFDPTLGEWWTGSNAATQGNKMASEPEGIQRFLAENARDLKAPEEMREELGFSTMLWTDDGKSELSFSCGGYNFGPYGPFNSFLLKTQRIERRDCVSIFRCLIDIWEPWQGSIWNRHIRSRLPQANVGFPEAGWMTYLRTKPDALGELSDQFLRVNTSHGVILVSGDAPPRTEDDEDLEKLNALQDELATMEGVYNM